MTPARARLVGGLVVLAALAVVTWLSLAAITPPAPVGADAPAEEFSAERAFGHVERVGSQVHVAGSAAGAEVRDYLVDSLDGLGLDPTVQEKVGADDGLVGRYAMAAVDNVVAVLPGTASTGRVILMAHYDSVQVSYGANDDGAGVATLLETARALVAGQSPRNDIVVVFTDAEEACLCGAEAFLTSDPLAAAGGVVLNFEARGSGGPAIMFETTSGNAGVVGMYGDAVPYPVSTSVAVEVYRILPNNTDFSPFRDSGRFTGLNSAYIDGSAVYHSPQDRPEYMDRASLQHHGSNALALARAFGDGDIAALAQESAGDSTYFPAFGVLVRFPGLLVWPLAVLAVLAVGVLAAVARRRGAASWPRSAAGFGLALVPLVLAPVGAQLLWLLLTALRPDYRNMADPWWPGSFRVAVVALVATILLTWYGLLRRRFGLWPLAIGGLAWLAVLGVALAAVVPGGSYLATIPALAGALTGLLAVTARPPLLSAAFAFFGAAVAVVILAPVVVLFFPALGLATAGAPAFFAVLLGLVALPALDLLYPAPPPGDRRRSSDTRLWAMLPAVVAGVLTVGSTAAGLAIDRFDADHPAPTQLMYALNADTRAAYWASEDGYVGDWLDQYVDGRGFLSGEFGLLHPELAIGAAEAADLPPPRVIVQAGPATGDARTLTVTVTPQRVVRLLFLEVPDATVTKATVQGREVPAGQIGEPFGIEFHAPPPGGVTFELEVAASGPTTIRAMDGSDGLDGLPGFIPRPAGIGIQGSHTSELVLVSTTVTG